MRVVQVVAGLARVLAGQFVIYPHLVPVFPQMGRRKHHAEIISFGKPVVDVIAQCVAVVSRCRVVSGAVSAQHNYASVGAQ
jgi:hypothetical protein